MGRPGEAVTPGDVVAQDGASRVMRMAPPEPREGIGAPVLLVPSMLQRWYILDLLEDASLVRGLLARGLDVFVLDWGDLALDRRMTWDEAVERVMRARRKVARLTRRDVTLVGYSQGATLAAIAAALEPSGLAALVDIAGPIDFSVRGLLAPLTDPRWCDADLLAATGGTSPGLFRGLIAALHPGATALSALNAAMHPEPRVRRAHAAVEGWADDAVALPPEVLRVWLKRLYQDNALLAKGLAVRGRPVDLANIIAPVMVISAERDTICPPASSTALLHAVSSTETRHLVVPGGHVSGIAGPSSPETVHRPLAEWLVHVTNPQRLSLTVD